MSTFCTARFARPTPPPTLTGGSLASFIGAFGDLKLATIEHPLTLKVKFGNGIDYDDKPTSFEESVDDMYSVLKEIEWDVACDVQSLEEMVAALIVHNKPLYRAFVQLGVAIPDVRRQIARVDSPDNECDLTLCDWALEIGPIQSSNLVSDEFFVGWIGVGIAGRGYLFPWKFSELVARLERQPGIRKAMDLCITTWPVAPDRPDAHQLEVRRKMGELWPYPELDRPLDWQWSLHETG